MDISKETSIVKLLSSYPLAREILKRNGIEFIGKNLSPLESLDVVGKGNSLSEKQIESILQEIREGMKRAEKELYSGALLTLTTAAAEELSTILKKKQGKKGFRLKLASDGCGLFSYDLDFATKKLGGEVACKTAGLIFYLEKKTLGMIKGISIDFTGEGFLFKNPNVRE